MSHMTFGITAIVRMLKSKQQQRKDGSPHEIVGEYREVIHIFWCLMHHYKEENMQPKVGVCTP